MKKYQAYSEYKDSGVEWLRELPINWTASKIKWVASSVMTGNTPNEDCFEGGFVDWYTPSDFEGDVDLRKASKRINLERLTKEVRFFPNNSILIVGIGATLGKVGLISKTSSSNQQINAIVPDRNVTPRFVAYALTNKTEIMRQLSNASTIGIMNQEKTKQIPISLPTTIEQKKIANFLDHETAKIDTLIEKQQQLIKLLKEKRQAVISHAVTKGLNPGAPMKDSGVEWLGEVPEHWQIACLKYHTTIFEQGWSPQCETRPAEVNEYGVLKVGCVNYGSFTSSENKALPTELKPQLQYLIEKGDLLVSRANTKELVGSAAVVDANYDNLILCDKLYRLRFNQNINTQFIAYYLALPIVRQQIELGATGASHSMQNIGQSVIKELPIVIPPITESIALINDLKKKANKYDEIISNAEKSTEFLKERRTAIISAAVTGKIDVRNWQPDDSQSRMEAT